MPIVPTRLRVSRLLLAFVYITTGILHFVIPASYARIIPPILPAPFALVYISGIAELAGGVGVLIPRVRSWAGMGLIALLIAVFPANIYMAYLDMNGWTVKTLLLLLRLPLQLLLMWWAYGATRPTDAEGQHS